MPRAAATLEQLVSQKRDELAPYFEKFDAVKGLDVTDGQAEEIRQRNTELTDLAKEWEEAKELEGIKADTERYLIDARTPQRPRFSGQPESRGDAAAIVSVGQRFVESDHYKSWVGRGGKSKNVAVLDLPGDPRAMKATFTTSGSGFTEYDRPPGIVLVGVQKLTVADLLAKGQTMMNTIRYQQETSFTNAAAATAEGGAKAQATWALAEADAPVRKIAVTSKVTEEMFNDFPTVRDYIDQRLPLMVRITEEQQLLSGSGVSPQITGILNTAGIQTQATGADTNPDAIYRAIVKVRTVGFFEPDGVVIHPNNWTPIRLLKTTTGEYVWGAPSESGPERIWGLLVDQTTGVTANTGLVGAFQLGAQVFYREGIRLEATNSNEDDFINNLIAIRCEIRLALAVYRPKAFCAVTSLGT